MPAVAIAFAGFAIEAAVVETTIFSVIAAVGATVGAVGAVTGNRDLMKIGGVLGLAGGIGMLADAATNGAVSAGINESVGIQGGGTITDAGTTAAGSSAGGFEGDAGDMIGKNAASNSGSAAPADSLNGGGMAQQAGAAPTQAPAVSPTDITPPPVSTDIPGAAPTAQAEAPVVQNPTNASTMGSSNTAMSSEPDWRGASSLDTQSAQPLTPYQQTNAADIGKNWAGGANGMSGSAQPSAFDSLTSKFSDFGKDLAGFTKSNPQLTSMLLSSFDGQTAANNRLKNAQAGNAEASASYTAMLQRNASAVPVVDYSRITKNPNGQLKPQTGMAGF